MHLTKRLMMPWARASLKAAAHVCTHHSWYVTYRQMRHNNYLRAVLPIKAALDLSYQPKCTCNLYACVKIESHKLRRLEWRCSEVITNAPFWLRLPRSCCCLVAQRP